ncbi:MAG TPA: Uma2 family endonuclease [Allosphingosinicella sp.]|nr:Uma2 family endonuclease [Allosphingosinicella sp.]
MNAVQEATTPQPVAITVDQFRLLDENGAFDQFSKTELIEGVIYAMQGQHRPHARAKTRLAVRLHQRLEQINSPLEPLVEASVDMGRLNAPEPDIALTSDPQGQGYVPLSSLALAIEVSDSSAAFDLSKKALLYAQQGIAEYWVVDLPAKVIHQLSQPSEHGYGDRIVVPLGEAITSVTIDGLTVSTEGLV